ncbi:DUF4145 domain-containing protein [Vibrio vulnificus]|nr:DUF4145 domain-containing protein [Vibrio vulnificus]RZQ25346.1 DUF4145 domain-containing protein [Vibrio vulnificus]RZQ25355.1 DUF4145 domain-containing protein [Vibrio vulnificus]RZQ72003.1 DUF4145 domain-containing protein [Vibrio vulnificus]RZR03996.1 DUF4145 domain-containing protein [Vibrio vulnificus]
MEVFVDSDYMLQVGDEIGLVKDNPRLLIIVSHSFVEMIVKTLSDHYLPEVKLKNHNQRLEKLRKEQVIDEFQFQVYDWFRDLRNKAAHTPLFRLSDSDFEALVGVVKREQLGVPSFHLFSIKLISELWNKHLDILGPAYLGKYC